MQGSSSVADLQKQLNEANQKVAALESKQTTNDEITTYKVKTAVAEAAPDL